MKPSLFAPLTRTELRELSAMMLEGVVKAGKLAHWSRGDVVLWNAAIGVQDDCFQAQADLFALECPAAAL